MALRLLRPLTWLVLLSLLVGSLPLPAFAAPAASQAGDLGVRQIAVDSSQIAPLPDVPTPTSPVPDVPFNAAPGLSLALQISPDPLAVGDTAMLSVRITNRTPYPAENLVVTAPTPDGALAEAGPITVNPVAGWRWTVGRLAGEASTTVTGTLRLVRMPSGEALVASAEAAADLLPAPAHTQGGALVIDRTRGPVDAAFTPGKSATLRSQDGRVVVDLPATASDRALTVRQTPNRELDPRGAPDQVGMRRSLGQFALTATDSAGQDVHQFKAPLSIAVAYTPEQLAARGIRDADLGLFWYDERAQRWQLVPTEVDAENRVARATVDHFTTFALSDLSSASALYIPSLQGFQVSSFTGAASLSIPIETPAGPGGLGPSLDLSYSSAASDGSGGDRNLWQAGWAGKGWSVSAEGFVARSRSLAGDAWDSFSLSFAGRSFQIVRGQLTGTTGCTTYTNTNALECWTWQATDENFVKVRAEVSGGDYIWRAWTPDGTRYEFTQVLYDQPSPSSTAIQSYKWLLTGAVDTHGNKITYTYVVDPVTASGGTVHPTYRLSEILWGYSGATPGTGTARYRAEFVVSAGSRWVSDAHGDTTNVDVDWEYPSAPNAYWESVTPHEKYRLNQINIYSQPTTGWQLVRRYNLYYASAADTTTPNVNTDSLSGQEVLTLKQVQRVASDGSTVLPATSFSYYARGTAQTPAAGANRIKTYDNGQGGKQEFAYQNVWASGAIAGESAYLHENYHRISQVTTSNTAGPDTSAVTTYTYTNPARNDIGFSAAVVYAAFPPSGNGNSRQFLASPEKREFRGHATVTEKVYPGTSTAATPLKITVSSFYQGNGGSGTATCSPTTTTVGGNAALVETDTCYLTMLDREAWKGRAFTVETQSGGGSVLQRTTTTFDRIELPFFGADASVTNSASLSNNYKRAGLWRAFTPSIQVDEQTIDGGTTRTKTTKTYYNTSCTADTATTIAASYGNVGCTLEQDGTTLLRKTTHAYAIPAGASPYIVDRTFQTAVYNASGYLLSLSNQFYDGAVAASTAPTIGELTRSTGYFDIPANTSSTTGITLHGSDTVTDYDAYGNPTTTTTYSGSSTRLFNGTSTTWGAVSGTARTVTTTYDTTFRVFATQESNPLGDVTKADYDERMGTLIRVTGPNSSGGTMTDCSLTSFNIPTTEETSCTVYDVFGRAVKLIKPGDSTTNPTTQATYFDGTSSQPFRYRVDQREASGAAGVRVLQTYTDGLGRTIQQKRESQDNAANIITDSSYDALGRVVAQSQPREVSQTTSAFTSYTTPSDPLYRATTTTYDALGRPLIVTAADSTTTVSSYGVDGDGPWTKVIDANSHALIHWNDVFGRLKIVREYTGTTSPRTLYATTQYTSDALDRLTRVTDTAGNIIDLTYDSLGRKLTQDDPDMGVWSYAYDPNGNMTSQTDAKNQRLCFYYDKLNRVTAKHQNGTTTCPSSAPATPTMTYTYDAGTNGKGHRTSMAVNGGASTSWTYDARGRTATVSQVASGLTLNYTNVYNTADQLTQLQFPAEGDLAAENVTYAYDAAGRPLSLCSSLGGCYAQSATYTPLDQPLTLSLGASVTRTATYTSPMMQLNSLSVTAGATTILARSYDYDNVGNVTSINDTTTGTPLGNQTFGYDDLNRLTSWTSALGTQSYSYNAIGNLTAKAGVSYGYPASGSTSVRPHTPSTVGGAAYSYDNNGNLLSGGGRTYTWTPENLPATITSGGVTETYGYDADSERVTRTVGGATTVYLGALIEQTGGAVKRYYSFNGANIAVRSASGVSYLHGDHLGSMGASSDGAGGAISRQWFDAWGDVQSGALSATTLNYTGQRLDGTGLLYYHARYYDPVLGRFLSPDTMTPNPANPQDFNRYSYASNNPLRYTDPTGHWIESALDVASIAFDIYDISQNGLTWTSGLALAADVASLALPVVTGGGLAVRAAMHADDLADAAHAGAVALEAADTAADVATAANKAENAGDVGRLAETCLNSFSADTPVATPDGEIAISAIVTGTVVLAYDEASGTTGAYAVTATIHHTDPAIVLLTVGDETLETTPAHPFFTRERGWVDAIDLRMGEHVPRLHGPDGVVQARSVVPRVQPMYNLTVATAHTFFVGEEGWLVHNCASSTIKVRDLDPLHSPTTSGARPDLEKLSDRELINSVTRPKNGDPIRINTQTGKVVDGNGRAYELLRRASNPRSSISPDMDIPYEPYTPWEIPDY